MYSPASELWSSKILLRSTIFASFVPSLTLEVVSRPRMVDSKDPGSSASHVKKLTIKSSWMHFTLKYSNRRWNHPRPLPSVLRLVLSNPKKIKSEVADQMENEWLFPSKHMNIRVACPSSRTMKKIGRDRNVHRNNCHGLAIMRRDVVDMRYDFWPQLYQGRCGLEKET